MNRPLPVFFSLALCLCLARTATAATNHFQFRSPENFSCRVDTAAQPAHAEWLAALPENGRTNRIEFGSRVVLQLKNPADLRRLTAGRKLSLARGVTRDVFILQAPDAATALAEAARLAAMPEVAACYPVVRREVGLEGAYAAAPTDFYFNIQWDLENRTNNAGTLGGDLNVRAAWPLTLGAGVTVAVCDIGIETTHVELTNALAGSPHTNFYLFNSNSGPMGSNATAAHATEVAGVIAAQLNNARMVGIAPSAKLASWVFFSSNGVVAADDVLMNAYQYKNDSVAIQNHSWGVNGVVTLNGPTLLEQIGISNAVTYGRGGRGVVMVRSAGNDRANGANADEDNYPNDPRVIAATAVATSGRALTTSEPGACILVAAPTRDAAGNGLFTTDLTGTRGVNTFGFLPPNADLSDYAFNSLGFAGSSAAAAQISGVCALILSANTNLSYRDVQQILILSARHFDFADADLKTNGVGLLVSHNAGFGIPDCGAAVKLARAWTNRPAATNLTFTFTNRTAIPDDGLRVLVTGAGVPANLASIRCLPGTGPHADAPTANLPLVDFGYGTNLAGFNLTNKGALIQRDTVASFATKINNAASLGAKFVVLWNYFTNTTGSGVAGGDVLTIAGGTDYTPVPSVFIGNSDGVALTNLFSTNATALAQISLNSTGIVFNVTNTLMCEHVGLRVQTDHPLRGDLRITLVSPMGTRSILQVYNNDTSGGPTNWIYYSTHHFFESSAGNWTAWFADESAGATGSVLSASLVLEGVPITDTDHDGLDDNWEQRRLSSLGDLTQTAAADPDKDGYSNAREQLMGTDPNVANQPFQLDLSRWSTRLARLSWPGSTNFSYEIYGGTNAGAPLPLLTNIAGKFPETEWFSIYTNPPVKIFRVRAVPVP